MARPKKDAAVVETAQVQEANSVSKDNLRAIQSMKLALRKKYGDDTFSEKSIVVLPSISTGSASLDAEIGNSGLVLGRIHEIYGDTGSGKTTIATLIAKNALNAYPDKFVLYIDYEQAFHMEYASSLGLDINNDRFIIVQPSSAEEGFDIMLNMINTGAISLVVADSIPAMQTKRELSGEFVDDTIGEKARFLSKAIPKLLGKVKTTNAMVLFINQIRDKISFMGGKTTPGGKAIPFYTSTRIEVARTGVITDKSDKAIGQEVRMTVRKNKVGQPFGVVNSNIFFFRGFDIIEEAVDLAIKFEIIIRGGAWYTLPTGERFQGKAACVEFYKTEQQHFENLHKSVMDFGANKNGIDEENLKKLEELPDVELTAEEIELETIDD